MLVFEVYLSMQLNEHAQERIFCANEAFNAHLTVPRGCFDSLSLFPRPILGGSFGTW